MNKNTLLLEERLSKLMDGRSSFLETQKPPKKSIRVNTLKTTPDDLVTRLEEQGFKLKPIPWTNTGYWTDGGTLCETVEYFLGHYYIQDASSMIPAGILKPEPDDFILDAAAAPGGKTIHMAGLMGNEGCIVANEVKFPRRAALRFNLSKHGVLNTVITSMDLSRNINTKEKFDKILLDAPCSCEGQLGRNPDALEQWSMEKIMRHSHLQKRMLASCLGMLKPGGVLVYSTCTLAPEENEEVVDHALTKAGGVRIEPFGKTAFKYRPGVTRWRGRHYSAEVEGCARIYPQDNDCGGFFIARLVKCGT
jgi:NOL1/NOP2/sun family putative RNA methylase